MGILKVIFSQKLKKRKNVKLLHMGILTIFSKKKWKMIIFRWFSISQICGFEEIFHWNRSFDNIFDKSSETKNGFPKILEVKKKVFSATIERCQLYLPLPQCCWENVKKCQNFTYGYFDKNSKNTIINRETVFTKIFEKTRTYGDFDENFQKFAGHLRDKLSKLHRSCWPTLTGKGQNVSRRFAHIYDVFWTCITIID